METQAGYTVVKARPEPSPHVLKRMEELLTQGVKFDKDKPRWDLLPIHITEEVVKVLTYGAKKYSDDNWLKVADLDKRYYAAAMRHLCAYRQGEENDPESGFSHLAHAICCLMFMRESRLLNEEKQPC